MNRYFRLFLIVLNVFYDIYKLIFKKNISWDESYRNKMLYGYSDFIRIDCKNINKNNFITFLFVILFYNILLKVQILFFVLFLFYFFIKKIFRLNNKIIISKNVYIRILIEQPKFFAFILCERISKLKLPSKKEIKYIFLNFNNVLIWFNIKFVINNSKIITNFIINLRKDPNLKLNIRYIDNKIKYIYRYEFDSNLIKFENTL